MHIEYIQHRPPTMTSTIILTPPSHPSFKMAYIQVIVLWWRLFINVKTNNVLMKMVIIRRMINHMHLMKIIIRSKMINGCKQHQSQYSLFAHDLKHINLDDVYVVSVNNKS